MALQADQLQPGKRLHSDQPLREVAADPGGEPEHSGQVRSGIHRARQAGEAADGLRVSRCRRFPAHLDGVRQATFRLRGEPCALPDHRAIGDRPNRRPRANRLRRSRRFDPSDQRGQVAGAGGVVLDRVAAAGRAAVLASGASAPDFEAVSWHVLLAPAKTPRDIVDRLHAEMKKFMSDPEMKKKTADIGLIPFDTPSVEGITDYIKSERVKWGALVDKIGLRGTQ